MLFEVFPYFKKAINVHRSLSGFFAIVIFSVCLPVKASLIFSFSFQGDSNDNYPGPISGTILGLVDSDVVQSASSVILESAVGHPDVIALPIDFVLDPNWNVFPNQFKVENGIITFANFYAECGVNLLACPFGSTAGDFSISTNGALLSWAFRGEVGTDVETASETVVFSAVDQSTPVSSPATLALLGLGLLGLRLRRK